MTLSTHWLYLHDMLNHIHSEQVTVRDILPWFYNIVELDSSVYVFERCSTLYYHSKMHAAIRF